MDTRNSNATTPEQLSARLESASPLLLLDVRKAEDFDQSDHKLAGSLRWDYHAGEAMPAELKANINVVVYCVKGAAVGIEGAQRLANAGYTASFLEGGLRAWQASGLPVVAK